LCEAGFFFFSPIVPDPDMDGRGKDARRWFRLRRGSYLWWMETSASAFLWMKIEKRLIKGFDSSVTGDGDSRVIFLT
jgi:hypothetical protein